MALTRRPGYCAIYGDCGKTSQFGDELPCPANVKAKELHKGPLEKLQNICGSHWKGPVCCTPSQVDQLESNLKKVAPILDSCPACKDNFYQLFCRFTCSPDQSQFVEILDTKQSLDGRDVVSELNYYVDPQLAKGIYDSCSEVKFSATNGKAMDLIGGGARDYKTFFKFLGDEKPMLGGSPFQMNFPWPQEDGYDVLPDGIERNIASVHGCSDEGSFHCSCIDCPASCPDLPALKPPQSCDFLGMSCASWGLLTGYFICLLIAFGVWYRFHKKSRPATVLDIQRLIEDDDDENDHADDPFTGTANASYYIGPYHVNKILQSYFTKLSYFCAKFPLSVISLCTLFALVCSLGIFWVELLDEPAKLWVGPHSIEAQEKAFFDTNFGMFYRTAQAFAINETGPILQDYDTVQWWFDVERRVADVRSELTLDSLEDFCFTPIGEKCVIQSVPQYFGGDITKLPKSTWRQKVETCARSPVRCLPPFEQPISPSYVFGPYNESVLDTQALVSTWVLVNDDTPAYISRVEYWELAVESLFKEVALEAEARGLRFSYSLESSLQRELTRSSTADVKIIILSYLAMFLYASLALGNRIRSGTKAMVESKFSLGLFGILVVALSVSSSIGICSLLGIKLTLIITEVIPFLVLAVGVDNIFLLVHYARLVNDLYPQYSIEERISEAVGLIGPSIFLSTSCEVVAIGMGASVAMPAVHNFAIYTALAVFINSALQLTMFVAAMALDQKRVQEGRADCAPCVVLTEEQSDDESTPDPFESQEDPRRFSSLISGEYAPTLLKRRVKLGVVSFFMAWLAFSLTILPKMELGLDQRLAVPSDSFLVDYFSDVYEYFQAGPPVYFVTQDTGVEQREGQQKLCGRFSTCDEYSLVNILEQESKRPEVSFLETGAASWVDDFLQWLNPDLDKCCLENKKGQLCDKKGKHCNVCYDDKTYEFNMDGFPEGTNFTHYVDLWLAASTDASCPLSGKASYTDAISMNETNILASQFRSTHTPLRSQKDYINSYSSARRIAKAISESTGLHVFPYSVFYVFFAQYRTIVRDTITVLGTAFAVVFVLAMIILGSPTTALIVTGVVAIMVLNTAGLCVLFGVSLNALSLVNLVICVGIGVEFCVHIARAYTFVHKVNTLGVHGLSRTERAFNALAGTGGTVFGGIAITKFIGVVILAFTRSKIFEVYYFRMWLALIFCATLHSLALLPVLLSYWGGRSYMIDDAGLVDQFGELEL